MVMKWERISYCCILLYDIAMTRCSHSAGLIFSDTTKIWIRSYWIQPWVIVGKIVLCTHTVSLQLITFNIFIVFINEKWCDQNSWYVYWEWWI